MSQPEVVVSAAHVRKSFGDKEVLRDISFEVGSGEVTVVLGPSGSGKTPLLRALDNITEGPVVVQGEDPQAARERALALLDQVGLSEHADKYPFQLSGGQQQRVGIARALALRPSVGLFDEPTSALDPETVGEVLQVMRDLAEQHWTMVVVTHEIRFARQVADEVLFIDGGVVVERGAPEQVILDPQAERTRSFLQRILDPL